MTTISLDLADEQAQARRALPFVAIAATLIGVALSVAFADSNGERIGEAIFIPVVAAVVFGVVVPRGLRHEPAGKRAVAMGAIGLLLVPVAFWSGLPVVLGSAAALLGHAGKRASRGAGLAITAYVLGILAVVGYVVVYVGDYLHTH